MIRRPPRSTQSRSSAASDVYKRQVDNEAAIVIADSHSRGQNLLLDRLPQDVQVVRGYPRPLYMVEGADESCDAALFVGYHAPIGTLHGSMDHTYSSASIYEISLI